VCVCTHTPAHILYLCILYTLPLSLSLSLSDSLSLTHTHTSSTCEYLRAMLRSAVVVIGAISCGQTHTHTHTHVAHTLQVKCVWCVRVGMRGGYTHTHIRTDKLIHPTTPQTPPPTHTHTPHATTHTHTHTHTHKQLVDQGQLSLDTVLASIVGVFRLYRSLLPL